MTAPAGTSPRIRRLAWAVAALAVAIPVALSLAPRASDALVAFELESFDAIERDDLDAAERVLKRAAEAGLSSPRLEYERAFVLELRGDLDGAARGYETLASSPDPEASSHGARAAKTLLGLRLLRGKGVERDPARGRQLLEEVCSDGGGEVCQLLEEEAVQPAAAE